MNVQMETKPHKKRKWLLLAAKLSISAGLLIWIVSRADLASIITALSHANLMWLILAACSPIVGIVTSATRWGGLLRAQGVRVSFPQLAQSCLVAFFVRQFLPSTIGGDAIRGYDSWKIGASKSTAVTAIIVDRLLGLLVLVLFAVVALLLSQELWRGYSGLFVVVCLAAGILVVMTAFVFLRSPRLVAYLSRGNCHLPRALRPVLERVLPAVTAYQGQTGQLVRGLFLSLLLQANVVTFYYLIGRAMGFAIPYHAYFLIVPIAVVVMLVPVSINGIGIRESIFVFLLGTYSVGSAEAVAFAWLEHGLFLCYGMLGGIVFALRNLRSKARVDSTKDREFVPPICADTSGCSDPS